MANAYSIPPNRLAWGGWGISAFQVSSLGVSFIYSVNLTELPMCESKV